MAFLLVSPLQKLLLFTDHEKTEFGEPEYHKAYPFLNDLRSHRYFPTTTFSFLNLPLRLATSAKFNVFPLREHSELLGVLIVGCCEHCICKTEELTVVEPILNQSVGAFQRALAFEEELGKLSRHMDKANQFHGLMGKDPKMQLIFKLIENVASTDTSVLIQGESGTGKELVANAIHSCSLRNTKPFTIINCSAYPSTLLESELFGHEKGAFTGATRLKAGRFEQADGGTVFLDEIGEISQSAQIKLLRVLQSRKFERLGGEHTVSVNIRILAATNKNLAKEVQSGNFREDLYYRLNVIPINIPPLRERKNDIFLLAKHFLNRFAREHQKTVTDFSSEAMHYLMDYYWPGNVRELENTIEHAVVLSKGRIIAVLDLPVSITENLSGNNRQRITTLSESEEGLIRKTLEECDWNKSKAAEKIGISRGTLYQKIRKYRIRN
jgi:two-component system response regulator HydG